MKNNYQPAQGDIIWLDMDPKTGHEMGKRRPVVVVSGNDALELIQGTAMVCPITSTDNRFPTHVPLEGACQNTSGFVVCEQVKSLDMEARNAAYKDHISDTALSEIINILKSMLD